jgi:xanthine dehydrogenase small subunit
MRNRIIFYLNGQKKEAGPEHGSMMLADYLRAELTLPGTKIVCAEGDCGACTVLRWFPWSSGRENPIFLAVNSCITTVAQMDGSSLVTVDALKKPEGGLGVGLTPVQKAMMECHGSQCGFCTPGFVMALNGLVEKRLKAHSEPQKSFSQQEVKNALTGNLCRCTGYQPIIDAGVSLDISQCESVQDRFLETEHQKDLEKVLQSPVSLQNEEYSFFAPTRLSAAVTYLKKNPQARLISAGTDLGVVHNKRKTRLTQLVSLHLIPELYSIQFKKSSRMRVGARVTLSELRESVQNKIPEFARFLDLFASPQIKNLATLVGNVGNASPIADTPPFLLVAGAKLQTLGPEGRRTIAIEDFYQGYRKTALLPGELIVSIEFDIPNSKESLALYKVSQRKDLDISTVNSAYRVKWKDSKKTQIESIRIAMGGMAAIPIRLTQTENELKGKALNPDLVVRAGRVLQFEMHPISDLRGSSSYRRVLAENLLARFFRECGVNRGL